MSCIGKDMKARMDLLRLTPDELADRTFMEKKDIDAILKDKIELEQIDEFDFSLICSALHCRPEFFTDEKVRERDLLVGSMNRGSDNEKSRKVKAKIQDFMNDFVFVTDVLSEVKEVF